MKRKFKLWDGIKNLLQDFLKGGTKYLVNFVFEGVLGITGASIVLAILSMLLRSLRWLEIPITMPAIVAPIAIVIVIVAVLLIQGFQKRLKSRSLKSRIVDGLLFELMRDGNADGPLCTKCKAKPAVMYDRDDNVTRVIFGRDRVYKYSCICGHEVGSSKPPDELLKEAQKYFQANK